jgi:hypothetical protein
MTVDPKDLAWAMLLFYSGGPWDRGKALTWTKLTGYEEATSKNLCNMARTYLTQQGAPDPAKESSNDRP